jgi:hypothetical protein
MPRYSLNSQAISNGRGYEWKLRKYLKEYLVQNLYRFWPAVTSSAYCNFLYGNFLATTLNIFLT